MSHKKQSNITSYFGKDDSYHGGGSGSSTRPQQGFFEKDGSHKSSGSTWDASHVRMPFSPHNITKGPGGNKSKWIEIHEALHRVAMLKSCDPDTIAKTIMRINPAYSSKWNLSGLVTWFHTLPSSMCSVLQEQGFQYIARAALELPDRVSDIQFLEPGQFASVTLKQRAIVSLLANMFFCTFPQRNSKSDTLPSVNFNRLFECAGTYPDAAAKLTMIAQYFITWCQRECQDRQFIELMNGDVLFTRRYLTPDAHPCFFNSQKPICHVDVLFGAKIENCNDSLQVDFANKVIGGGVLGRGAVQEEIRMAICPEMIVARLFTKTLEDHEALFFKGVEQYSLYMGYSRSLEYAGAFNDNRRDDSGSFHTEVVAIDATFFQPGQKELQWDMDESIQRELHKAYIGFRPLEGFSKQFIATGNWGCGAFNGDLELKAIIQILAGSECGRELKYVIVDEKQEEWSRKFRTLVNLLVMSRATVSQLYGILEDYSRRGIATSGNMSLFDYITFQLQSFQLQQ